jgi:hypothetical protein
MAAGAAKAFDGAFGIFIRQKDLDEMWAEHGHVLGGVKQDYFALLYLMRKHDLQLSVAAKACAFSGNDYGIDAFHIDTASRNLYLYQFKWSEDPMQFKESIKRLYAAGIERIFGDPYQDERANPVISALKTSLHEKRAQIDRVFIDFVFKGDAEEAKRCAVLAASREDLETKYFFIHEYFGERPITVEFRFVSSQVSPTKPIQPFSFEIPVSNTMPVTLPTGEQMHMCFLRLIDLCEMYDTMKDRFFERNIRSGLSFDRAVNKRIRDAFERIVLKQADDPEVFAFNHNGVTLCAQDLKFTDGVVTLTEPRLLNGAQTLTNFSKFVEDNQKNAIFKKQKERLARIQVITKIVSHAAEEFVTNVTICNNRQNPVEPWNLRASDKVQLALQDRFRTELSVFYERQEGAYAKLRDSELLDQGYIPGRKPVQIKHLAQTLLASQGEVGKMARLPEIFEIEKNYNAMFSESYIKTDPRRILLAYKMRSKLRQVLQDIQERLAPKYEFLRFGRNLIWGLLIQGALNDPNLPTVLECFGANMVQEQQFTVYLKSFGPKLSAILKDASQPYSSHIKEGKFGFLRNAVMFSECMYIANSRYGWTKRGL